MARRKGLGRGLEALLPEETAPAVDESNLLHSLPVEKIRARDDQPRQTFDPTALAELAESLKRFGILQPLVVTEPDADGVYTLIAGERRLRAAKMAGLAEVPALVRTADEAEVAEIALVENIQRENLNPVEEAVAYEEMMQAYGYTQQELSERIGKSRSAVANTVRLLHLDEISLFHLKQGDISAGQARALLSVPKMSDRRKLLDKLLSNPTNVRKTEQAARRVTSRDIYVEAAENRLMEALGTKVQIVPKKRGGRIELQYYSQDDLQRLLELLTEEE